MPAASSSASCASSPDERSEKKIFDMLMESQYWPPEQMLAFQRNQLAQLLRHAKQNVPFYKARLDPVLRKNGEIDWNRWQKSDFKTPSSR